MKKVELKQGSRYVIVNIDHDSSVYTATKYIDGSEIRQARICVPQLPHNSTQAATKIHIANIQEVLMVASMLDQKIQSQVDFKKMFQVRIEDDEILIEEVYV